MFLSPWIPSGLNCKALSPKFSATSQTNLFPRSSRYLAPLDSCGPAEFTVSRLCSSRTRLGTFAVLRRVDTSCSRSVCSLEGESADSGDFEGKNSPEGAESFFDVDTTAIEYFTPIESAEPTLAGPENLAELPLFPLPLVLSPGQPIPLHIFEMRYRQMFQRIRDGDGRFGIVMFDKDRNAHATIGTMAEITVYEPLPDGRIMTSSTGRQRFRVLKYTKESPYLVGLVEYFDDESRVESAEQIAAALKEPLTQSGTSGDNGDAEQSLTTLERRVWTALGDVLRLSNKLYNRVVVLSKQVVENSPETVLNVPENLIDPEQNFHRQKMFSFAVSSILDMPVRQQQLLLQTRDTAKRLLKQAQLLEGARQYLAAQVTIKNALGET
ncbi:LON peptidase N-terminal domain and RING finger protein 3 [Cyanidiococcus yangmingshanensis]|uniref:LON peptidase N-terminal domain and RING finger protein 3 n=1 Tax=Cyanidiococcus yangmingshanensis TaxID=2690220 RepID=A0A7J7ID69_9RHOD|nr:LON peptidase N-terminal domain and RING finger protein 3 [Cyanidiococcus yangmingshanensis]